MLAEGGAEDGQRSDGLSSQCYSHGRHHQPWRVYTLGRDYRGGREDRAPSPHSWLRGWIWGMVLPPPLDPFASVPRLQTYTTMSTVPSFLSKDLQLESAAGGKANLPQAWPEQTDRQTDRQSLIGLTASETWSPCWCKGRSLRAHFLIYKHSRESTLGMS